MSDVPPLPRLFDLPLPPTSNHIYEPISRRNKQGVLVHGKRWSDEYERWRDEVWFKVQPWQPPAKTPLHLIITLYIPKRIGRRADISGFVKAIEDSLVGSRSDQWIDAEEVYREVAHDSEGYASIYLGAWVSNKE